MQKINSRKLFLILLLSLLLTIYSILVILRNEQIHHWQAQASEAHADLYVFCLLRLNQTNLVPCDQWATRLLNEDISRTDAILVCNEKWNQDS